MQVVGVVKPAYSYNSSSNRAKVAVKDAAGNVSCIVGTGVEGEEDILEEIWTMKFVRIRSPKPGSCKYIPHSRKL